MLDPTEKVSDHHSSSSELEDQSKIQSPSGGESKKTCADCGTSKTPLWRGGPAGPKSLCNACGIRSRKKRRAVLGMSKPEDKKSKRGENLKERFLAMGREVLMQKRSKVEKQWRKLGEEEQAAMLLMALSYGSVYA